MLWKYVSYLEENWGDPQTTLKALCILRSSSMLFTVDILRGNTLTPAACEGLDCCCPPRPGLPRDKVRRLPLLSRFNSNPYLSSSLSVLPDLVQWRLPLREESWWKYMAIPCPPSDWHRPVPLDFTSVVCLEALAYQCASSCRWGSACPCFSLWCSQRASLMSAPLSWASPYYTLCTHQWPKCMQWSQHKTSKWCTHL